MTPDQFNQIIELLNYLKVIGALILSINVVFYAWMVAKEMHRLFEDLKEKD